MLVLDKDKNRIKKIKSCTFSELKLREREHLQIWLENTPEAFGEELLFIQKEFDGFDDTRKRQRLPPYQPVKYFIYFFGHTLWLSVHAVL